MNNLRVISEKAYHLLLPKSSHQEKLSWIGRHPSESTVYCGSHNGIWEVETETSDIKHSTLHLKHADVLFAEYLLGEGLLFLALSNGTLLHCWSTEQTVMFEVPCKITCCKWSPDQEILVLTTESSDENSLVLLSSDYSVITHQDLDPEGFGEMVPVTVGWGKKETQFHGSEGKEAAKAKREEVAPINPDDGKRPKISWRGDGQYFAVNSINLSTQARVIRVYDRQGFLQSTSELVSGIQPCLSWKPSGAIIATCISTPSKLEVAFFERNGLRHGEFSLLSGLPNIDPHRVKVNELAWNHTSEILMVWISVAGNQHQPSTDRIQLWTCANYHWYLKQSFVIENDAIAGVCWSDSSPYHLNLLKTNGELISFMFTFDIHRSSDSSATVAVIDGPKVLLTSFGISAAAPPSATHEILVGSCVNSVSFNSLADYYEMAVLTDDRQLLVFISDRNAPHNPPNLYALYDFPLMTFSGIYWISGQLLAAVEPIWKDGMPLWGLWKFSIRKQSDRELESLPSMELIEDEKTCRLISYLDAPVSFVGFGGTTAYVCFTDGSVANFQPDGNDAMTLYLRIPERCDHFLIDSTTYPAAILASSSISHKLYLNGRLVADSWSSFLVANGFLIYTTVRHKLVCIPFHAGQLGSSVDEREVERGSKLVQSFGTAVVLQMPRGNLEIIHPRSLVISKIVDLMEKGHRHSSGSFKEAFELARVHRLDMNLLVDINPDKFLHSLPHFMEELKDAASMNIFIASLNEEDTTATIYRNHFPQPKSASASATEGKKNPILRRIIQLLEKDAHDMELSLLACYVYMSPPDLASAMRHVQDWKQSGGSKISPDAALKFLLYSVDVNELFNVALGTYDFDLVLMVAEKSRKDPKEYIPFLNQLRAITPEHYQHFQINKHLKRFERALSDISHLGPEFYPEALELIKTHNLFKEALRVFLPPKEIRSEILKLYGQHLMIQKSFTMAGVMFMNSGAFTEGFDCFKKCGEWELAMACVARAGWDDQIVKSKIELLVLSLKSSGQHAAAAGLQMDRLKDGAIKAVHQIHPNAQFTPCIAAFALLLEGRCWDEAYLMLSKEECGPDARNKLTDSLRKYGGELMEQVRTTQENLKKYSERLKIVRELKLVKKESGQYGDYRDDFSETSSVSERSTSSSQFSRTTSKSKRKEEKKKRNLREGGRYEDLALLDALKNLYKNVDKMIVEVGTALKHLAISSVANPEDGLLHVGDNLQSAFNELVYDCKGRKDDIWNMEALLRITGAKGQGFMYGPNSTANTISAGAGDGFGASDEVGEYTLADFALFVPPELNVTQWNGLKIDHFGNPVSSSI